MGSMLIAIVVAQAGLPSAPASSAPQDDVRGHGFLFGIDLGAGYSTFGDVGSNSSGLTVTSGLHAGYFLSSHFVVGVHLFGALLPDGPSSGPPHFELSLLAVGPELSFLYRGWTFAVTPELLRVDTAFGSGANRSTAGYQGRGVGVAIARQWPIGRRIRGGLVAHFNYAYLGYGYDARPDGFLFIYEKRTISMLAGSLGGLISF
jgi:hypothetical protein